MKTKSYLLIFNVTVYLYILKFNFEVLITKSNLSIFKFCIYINLKQKIRILIECEQLKTNIIFFFLLYLDAQVVIIPAGVPRKPGMTRDDLFNTNAGVVRDIASAISRSCPNALVAIITNPVNSCVPIASEVLKKVHFQ